MNDKGWKVVDSGTTIKNSSDVIIESGATVVNIHKNSGGYTLGKTITPILTNDDSCKEYPRVSLEMELEQFDLYLDEGETLITPSIKKIKEVGTDGSCPKEFLYTWFNDGDTNTSYAAVTNNTSKFTAKNVDDGRFVLTTKNPNSYPFTTSRMNFKYGDYYDCGYPKITKEENGECTNISHRYSGVTTGHKIGYATSNSAITDGCFSGITHLVRVYFPSDDAENVDGQYQCYSTKTIGRAAFRGCSDLSAVTFNQVTNIGEEAFSGCTQLVNIDWGNKCCSGSSKINTINTSAFTNCGMTKIEFPQSLVTIGDYAFASNNSLTSVTFSTSVQITTVGNYAFGNCNNLKEITFPQEFGTIPPTIKRLGNYVFSGCSELTSIKFLSETPPTITSNTFSDIGGNWTIYVNGTYVVTYRNAWRNTVDFDVDDKIQAIQP